MASVVETGGRGTSALWSLLRDVRTIALCSTQADGSVHAVAMYFTIDGERLLCLTQRRSQKVVNVRRDPRVTVSGRLPVRDHDPSLRSVEMAGLATILDDEEARRDVLIGLARRRGDSPGDEATIQARIRQRVVIQVKPLRVIEHQLTLDGSSEPIDTREA